MKLLIAFLTVFITLSGCTWVELDQQGYNVALIDEARTSDCEKIGSTSNSVMDNIGPIYRSEKKVREELLSLAKNQAGAMGGNAVVPQAEEWNGAQAFDVYLCD